MLGTTYDVDMTITKQDVVDRLNIMLKLDSNFTSQMVNNRLEVNNQFALDKHFVCLFEEGKDVAGLLGILNGLFTSDDGSKIAADYDDKENITKFCLINIQSEK